MTAFSKTLSRLRDPVGPDAQGNYACWCPFHPDGQGKPPHQKSLSVHPERGFRCFACGEKGSIKKLATKLGVTADSPPRSKIVATYAYVDEQGQILFEVVRYAPKDFRQRRPDGKGGWLWNLQGVRRVLYRLPELLSQPEAQVFIVEGEKAADAARSLGLLSTTSSQGAGSASKTDWSPLAGRLVVLLPDNDDAGRKYAKEVADLLGKLKPQARAKVLELPGLSHPGDDIVEFIAMRRAAGKSNDDIKSEILQLSNDAPELQSEPEIPTTIPFTPFPLDTLPVAIRGFVAQGAKALRCDASFIAIPLLVALAAAIGNTRRVRLKRSWTEPSVLWGVIIGSSGTLKSPAIDLAHRPVQRRQAEMLRDYAEELEAYEKEKLNYEKELTAWKRSKADEDPPKKPEKPVPPQLVVSDITVESLAMNLKNAPRGLLLARDELAGWIGSFDQYKKGKADAPLWLEMHRAGFLKIDRKTGEHQLIFVPHAAVSITGGIQPSTLARALTPDFFENGLAARILMVLPEHPQRQWSEEDVSAELELAVMNVFECLWGLKFENESNENGDEKKEDLRPLHLFLAPAAKREWITFYNEHAQEQRSLSDNLAAAWSKLEGYAARFALVLELCKWASGPSELPPPETIDEQSMLAAIKLTKWFCQETRRVYAVLGASEEKRARQELLQFIQRHGGQITIRALQRSGRYDTAEEADAALEGLVEAGLGRWENIPPGAGGGPASKMFALNNPGPQNAKNAADKTDTTSAAPEGVLSDLSVVSTVSCVERAQPHSGGGDLEGGVVSDLSDVSTVRCVGDDSDEEAEWTV